MTELLLNILNDDPDSYEVRMEALRMMEQVLKEAGSFANEIREFMDSLELPPEPPDPKVLEEMQRKAREEEEAQEAERIKLEEEVEAKAAAAAEADEVNGHPAAANGKAKNPKIGAIQTDSRAGSRRGSASSVTLAGTERRGSYYGDDISKKATVAMVVDDPDSKQNINNALNQGRTLMGCIPCPCLAAG